MTGTLLSPSPSCSQLASSNFRLSCCYFPSTDELEMASTSSRRSLHAAAVLGPELSARLPQTKVLLVGAGGIGCELCMYTFDTGQHAEVLLPGEVQSLPR